MLLVNCVFESKTIDKVFNDAPDVVDKLYWQVKTQKVFFVIFKFSASLQVLFLFFREYYTHILLFKRGIKFQWIDYVKKCKK